MRICVIMSEQARMRVALCRWPAGRLLNTITVINESFIAALHVMLLLFYEQMSYRTVYVISHGFSY